MLPQETENLANKLRRNKAGSKAEAPNPADRRWVAEGARQLLRHGEAASSGPQTKTSAGT